MLAFSPQLFATVVTGALRLGRAGYQAHLQSMMDDQDIRAFVPTTSHIPIDNPTSEAAPLIELWTIDQVTSGHQYLPGKKYEGIFETRPGDPTNPVIGANGRPKLNPSRPDLFEAALQEKVLLNAQRHNQNLRPKEIRQSLIVFQTRAWIEDSEKLSPSPWGMFFRNMLDVGFDILAVQPGLLGIGGNVEAFIAALLPNLAVSFDANDVGKNNILREITETFSEAALKSLADNPELVTSEERWKPLITGVLRPVHEDVVSHGVNQLFAENRLRELLSGPVAFGALKALSENSDDFLKGDLTKGSIPGLIVRETLGVVASGTAEGFRVRQFFTDQAAMTIMASALKVAKNNPQLFIKEGRFTDAGTAQGRNLLTIFADTFLTAPQPFRADKSLAVDLACKSLDVMSDYAVARLATHAGDDAHRQARCDMAGHVISDLLHGFQRRLTGEKENLLADVFSRSQLVDVMQIMAKHVAKSPHLFISDSANPQIVSMAEAVAQAIAEDTSGLLSGEDWTAIITVAMDVALKNPGRLFSLDNANPGSSIALALISRILKASRDGMASAPGKRPWLLFGETLSEAIRVTLAAAASGAIGLISDPALQDAHLNEVVALANRLNELAATDEPSKAISAADWMTIYTYYIAHVLENGPGTVDGISDDTLLAALTGGVVAVN